MSFFLLFAASLLIAVPCAMAQSSLLLTTAEQGIQKKANAVPSDPAQTIKLNGIIYWGPGVWTVWLNGVSVTPQKKHPIFTLRSLDSNHVIILIPRQSPITLRVGESAVYTVPPL